MFVSHIFVQFLICVVSFQIYTSFFSLDLFPAAPQEEGSPSEASNGETTQKSLVPVLAAVVSSEGLAEQGTKEDVDLEAGAATKNESLTNETISAKAAGTEAGTVQLTDFERPMGKVSTSLPVSKDKNFPRSSPQILANLKDVRPPSVLTGAGEVLSTDSNNPRAIRDKNLANLRNASPSLRLSGNNSSQGSPTEFVGQASKLFQPAYDEVAKMLDNNLLVPFKSSDAFQELQRHKFLLVGDAGMK